MGTPSHDGGKWLKFVFDQGQNGKTHLRVGINAWGINLHWQMNNAKYMDDDEGLCTRATKKVNWHRQWKLTCNKSMLSKQYNNEKCDNDDDKEKDEPDDDCSPATQQLAEEACRECPDQYDPDSCIFDVCQAPNPQDAIALIPDMCQDDFDDPDCPDGFYMPDCHINAEDDCNCRELCEAEPNHLGYHYLDDVEGQNCCCFTKGPELPAI